MPILALFPFLFLVQTLGREPTAVSPRSFSASQTHGRGCTTTTLIT